MKLTGIIVGVIQKQWQNLIFLSRVKAQYVNSLIKDYDYKQNEESLYYFDQIG